MESLTYVAPLPSPPWRTGARVGSHTLAFVHAHRLTHTWNTFIYTLDPHIDLWVQLLPLDKTVCKFAVGDFTHSSDTFSQCSPQGRSTHCSSYTDLRSYREDCTQLRNTAINNCEDIRRLCAHDLQTCRHWPLTFEKKYWHNVQPPVHNYITLCKSEKQKHFIKLKKWKSFTYLLPTVLFFMVSWCIK